MTAALAVAIFLVFAAWMAWRGYRRGALRTLGGWLPFVAAGAVLTIGLWIAWLAITFLVLLVTVALVAAVATLVLCWWVMRSAARRAAPPPGGQRPCGRWRASLRTLDRSLGGALGLLAASILSLAFALLGSTLPLAYALRPQSAEGPAQAIPGWVRGIGRACGTVADVASLGVLDHIPRLGAYAREIRALVVILNAPPHQLRRLAERRGLIGLADLPEVREALADEAYLGLLERVAAGDVGALRPLAEHPLTSRLRASPPIRQLAATLTPSTLARDLAADSAPRPRPAPAGRPEALPGWASLPRPGLVP